MKHRKTLFSRLTARHLLIFRSEENFADKRTFSVSYAWILVVAFTIFLLLLAFAFYLSNTFLAFWFNPKYEEQRLNQRLVSLSVEVDSLAAEVERKDHFIMNFRNILSENSTSLDSANATVRAPSHVSNKDLDYLPAIDSQIRSEFEDGSYTYTVESGGWNRNSDFSSITFFSPITGIVTGEYDVQSAHYGVDVVANENEPVKAVADGTVILSNWTDETGHVIAVQHSNNLLSLYKHNSVLLKKVGNFVQAGEIIAIIGNSGELTTGPHLHFELWYNGNPTDPQEFISF